GFVPFSGPTKSFHAILELRDIFANFPTTGVFPQLLTTFRGLSAIFWGAKRLPCNFAPFGNFSTISNRSRAFLHFSPQIGVFLQFSALQELFCNFPQIGGFYATSQGSRGSFAIFYLPGDFLQFLHLLEVFCNFPIPEVFLQFSALPGAFMTFPTNRKLLCNSPDSRDISVIFPFTGTFLQFWTAEGLFCNFFLNRGSFAISAPFGGISAIFSHPTDPREMRGLRAKGGRGSKDPWRWRAQGQANTPPSFYRGEGGEEEEDRRYPPSGWKGVGRGGLPPVGWQPEGGGLRLELQPEAPTSKRGGMDSHHFDCDRTFKLSCWFCILSEHFSGFASGCRQWDSAKEASALKLLRSLLRAM
ncbi:hypothetical protein Taro_002714, partial [Colocasia esculenta]|nr:hypothetical protein [Colocasia esculenta]